MSNATTNNITKVNVENGDFGVLQTVSKVFCMFVLMFGFLGNSLVLAMFMKKLANLKPFEWYLISLSFSDLIGSLIFPLFQYYELDGSDFKGIGDGGCQIIFLLVTLGIANSSFTLTLVSVDRYLAFVHCGKGRKINLKWMIPLTWILGFSLTIFYLAGNRIRLHDTDGRSVCRYHPKSNEEAIAWTLLMYFLQSVMPFIVMSILYFLIVREIKHSTVRTSIYLRGDALIRRNHRNRRTTKIFIFLVLAFFICVTPSNTFYLFYLLEAHNLPSNYIYPIHSVLTMLRMSNNCINPVIYSRLHNRKSEISDFFCFLKPKEKTQDSYKSVRSGTQTTLF